MWGSLPGCLFSEAAIFFGGRHRVPRKGMKKNAAARGPGRRPMRASVLCSRLPKGGTSLGIVQLCKRICGIGFTLRVSGKTDSPQPVRPHRFSVLHWVAIISRGGFKTRAHLCCHNQCAGPGTGNPRLRHRDRKPLKAPQLRSGNHIPDLAHAGMFAPWPFS